MREAESSRKTLLMTRTGTELQTDKQNERGVNLFTYSAQEGRVLTRPGMRERWGTQAHVQGGEGT